MTFKNTIVVSVTLVDAQQLARALGIPNAVLVSLHSSSSSFRGIIADRIFIDNRCWPLDDKFRRELFPCILGSERGSIFVVSEINIDK